MEKRYWALALIAVMALLVSACSGGGGNLVPTEQPAMQDTLGIKSDGTSLTLKADPAFDGPVYKIPKGTSSVVGGQTFGTVIAPNRSGVYQQLDTFMNDNVYIIESKLWLDGVLQERVSATQHKLDTRNLPIGYKGKMKILKQMQPLMYKGWYATEFNVAQYQWVPNNNGDGGVWEFIAGGAVGYGLAEFLAIAACPDAYKEVDFEVTGSGMTPPPVINHNPTLDPEGPTALRVDQGGTWTSNASDQDSDVLTYRWFVNGLLVGTTPNLNYTFTAPGTYLVRVEVRDGRGGFAFHEWTVVVTENQVANLPPVAKLKLIGSNTGQVPFTVQVDASESYDPDGSIVWYDYFFYGGGGHSEGGSNITTKSNTYTAAGPYNIWLRVRDDDGVEDWTDTGIQITATPGGPTWGDDPFDQELLLLDLNPDGPADYDGVHVIGLDSTRGQESNPFIADVFYDGALVISGSQGRYWSMALTTTAPNGSLTADGIFHSAISGPGVYLVTAHFTINTLPDPLDDISLSRRIRVD